MAMEEVTVVIGHRGGGQVLGVFTDGNKVRAMKELVDAFDEKGYVSFEKIKVNDFQFKKFGLYFK
jgi:hypothetical protein